MMFPSGLTAPITHWVATPGTYGGFSFSVPVVLNGRWEQRAELFLDQAGQKVVSRAIVYLDTDVALEDYLFEGESTVADPTTLAGTEQVRAFNKIPDLANLEYLRKAFL